MDFLPPCKNGPGIPMQGLSTLYCAKSFCGTFLNWLSFVWDSVVVVIGVLLLKQYFEASKRVQVDELM